MGTTVVQSGQYALARGIEHFNGNGVAVVHKRCFELASRDFFSIRFPPRGATADIFVTDGPATDDGSREERVLRREPRSQKAEVHFVLHRGRRTFRRCNG